MSRSEAEALLRKSLAYDESCDTLRELGILKRKQRDLEAAEVPRSVFSQFRAVQRHPKAYFA